MHILSLSLDAKVLDSKSVVASRTRAYGELVTSYTVLVPAGTNTSVQLSPNVTVYGVHGFSKVGTLLSLFSHAQKLWKRTSFDLVTSQDAYFLGFVGALLSSIHHCAFEVQAHGIEKNSFIRKRLARFVYRRADVVRTVSHRLAQILTSQYGVDASKIVVVPVHVDVSSLGFGTEELVLKTNTFKNTYKNLYNICMVGRLVSVKNISLAILAVSRLSKIYPDTHLHIVGEGALRSSLENLVAIHCLSTFVTFHGEKSGLELGALYSACDCFVHTANSEGYGMVLIEALHAGLPIVTTDIGCVGDVVRDGGNALVVPVRDLDALVNALTRLREEPTLSKTLSAATKKSVAALPSYGAVLARYKTTWETAIATHKNSG